MDSSDESGAGATDGLSLVRLRREVRDADRQDAERVRAQSVVGVPAPRLGGDEAGFTENAQVVADGGLPSAGVLHEVAGTHLLLREQSHDLRTERIAEELHGSLGDVRLRVRSVTGSVCSTLGYG